MKYKSITANTTPPYVMHIDLNSCFAIIEQQANRLLRGKPVGVSAYATPHGFVLAASYEAKAKGIKLGVNNAQARAMCPGIVILTPDPSKYREAHRRFKEILQTYSAEVVPKSIDEFILNLANTPALRRMTHDIQVRKKQFSNHQGVCSLIASGNTASCLTTHSGNREERCVHNQAMLQLGLEIKQKIAESLGEWVTVNVGIATNRFLAKYAAGFGKPNGMTLIDYQNLEEKYGGMALVDLPGINVRYRARLRTAGIYTPLDFLHADLFTLRKRVFKSINGLHWYSRLRGYEADAVEFSTKSIGHQYALPDKPRLAHQPGCSHAEHATPPASPSPAHFSSPVLTSGTESTARSVLRIENALNSGVRNPCDIEKLEKILMKLSEKTGRRLRKGNYVATGIHLYLGFVNEQPMLDPERAGFNLNEFSHWNHGEKVYHRLYSTWDIYHAAKKLLHSAVMERSDEKQGSGSFGASTQHRTSGIGIQRSEYYSAQAKNTQQPSSDDSFDVGQAWRPVFRQRVRIMSVHVFGLEPYEPEQMNLFQVQNYQEKSEHYDAGSVDVVLRQTDANKRVSDALDAINNRYGEFVITPALMIEMQGEILDRIAFGAVREL